MSALLVTLQDVENAIKVFNDAIPEVIVPTSNDIEIAVSNYQPGSDEKDDELIIMLTRWQRANEDSTPAMKGLLGYLVTQGFGKITSAQVEEASEFPCGLQAYLMRNLPAAELRSRAKKAYTQGLRERNKWGTAEGVKDSFDLYRLILETKNFDDDRDNYIKAATAVAGMRCSSGELPAYSWCPLYQLIPYLQCLIEHGCNDLATVGILDTIQKQLDNLPVSDRFEPAPTQSSGSQHVNPQESCLHNGKSWTVDRNHPPLTRAQIDCVHRSNPDITPEFIEDMEYKVFTDRREVSGMLDEARNRAESSAMHQRSSGSFPVVVTNAHQRLDAPDFQSEASAIAGMACAKGNRTSMEDAHTARSFQVQLNNRERLDIAMTAVCDGHSVNYAGHLTSGYVVNSLEAAISRRLVELNPDGLTDLGVVNALTMACVDIDRSEYLYRGGIDYTGSTGNIAMIINDRLWVVNVGDSRAILVLPDGRTLQASEDMKPGRGPSNRGHNRCTQEVVTRGGRLSQVPGKVEDPRNRGTLSTTHAFGDHNMGGVISARPDITSYKLQDLQGAVMVQICDGVSDVATTDEIGALVVDMRRKNWSRKAMAEVLVQSAYQAGSGDNLTAVVSRIPVLNGGSGAEAGAGANAHGVYRNSVGQY